MIKSLLFIVVVAILCVQSSSQNRRVTNEDIKDILLSLLHLQHGTQDKLERHEMREKNLGEIIKRSLGALDRRHSMLEPIKGMLERLDKRLAGVETILMQNEEQQRLQTVVTNNTVEALVQSIESLNHKISLSNTAPPPSIDPNSITKLSSQIEDIKSALNDVKTKVDSYDTRIQKLDATTSKVIDTLAEKNDVTQIHPEKYQVESNTTLEIKSMLNSQKTILKMLVQDVEDNGALLSRLPTLHEVTELSNNTLFTLRELQDGIEGNNLKLGQIVDENTMKLDSNLAIYQENTNKSIGDLAELHQNVYSGIAKSYEALSGELQALTKIEKLVVQTGDNVLDVKRRVEYGVHQVITDVTELVKEQDKDLNATVNKRFDDIELTILDNQSDALANLTTKLETEMSQVWRQIGIMYQQLTASATTLDRLQAQTDTYVNGSLTSMDSMTNKVAKITGKMAEVDSNLNYLVGKLSLTSDEFNRIKHSLGTALDEIRGSFQVVRNKIKNVGPGPHKIPENEIEKDEKK